MFIRWLLAASHLLALGIGLGAVVVRAGALRGALEPRDLTRLFAADGLWGLAALIWIPTGLLRAFGGFEKGAAYYLDNSFFWLKMGMLLMILVLEAWPAVGLVRWRLALRAGATIDRAPAPLWARMSYLQAGLVVLMVLAATAMARGYGAG